MDVILISRPVEFEHSKREDPGGCQSQLIWSMVHLSDIVLALGRMASLLCAPIAVKAGSTGASTLSFGETTVREVARLMMQAAPVAAQVTIEYDLLWPRVSLGLRLRRWTKVQVRRADEDMQGRLGNIPTTAQRE